MCKGIAGLLFIFFFSTISFSQIPSGPPPHPPNKITLTVRVKLPNDEPIGTAAQVQLVSGMGGPIAETFTHADGRVEFTDVAPGLYRIIVSGSDIETTTSDSFDIGDNDRTRSEIIHVKPSRVGSSTPAGTPTISSQELNIPDKARNEWNVAWTPSPRATRRRLQPTWRRLFRYFRSTRRPTTTWA